MELLTDNPITLVKEDKFGFNSYASVLKDAILQAKPLPLCVGIFGAWGSGKSSFMNMLEDLIKEQAEKQTSDKMALHIKSETWPVVPFLDAHASYTTGNSGISPILCAKPDKIKTIWFNPWKYDKKEDLWNALIQTILNSIIEAQTVSPEVREKAKQLALATTWLALKKTITAVTAGVISAGDFDKVIEAFNKRDEKYYSHINQFEKNFADVVKDYTKDGKLVIFIDDLDRCLPENAITVLESLKLFIGDSHCIFVLGMDHSIVEAGIKSRYGNEAPIAGRDYLDKIIQVPFFLPPVSHEKLKDSLPKDEAFSEEIWNIIRLGMGGNPRKTRRFVNSFYLLRSFLNQPDQVLQKQIQTDTFLAISEKEQNLHLARILVFQISFPDFYQHLQLIPADWAYLNKYIIQGDAGDRERTLKEREELKQFWEDKSLVTFIRNTSGPPPYGSVPRGEVVSLLLQATNLVQTTSPGTKA